MTASPHRRAAFRAACRLSGLPLYAADLALSRGRCLARRCGSRWAVTRVSLDFRAESVDRIATLECAICGRTWRRVRVPALRSKAGYQSVRLTLIVPAKVRRWRSRGTWHREGDDAAIIRNADLGDLDEIASAHAKRADRLADLRAARKAKREAESATVAAETREWLDRMHARDAEREAEESAAAARDAARGES